MYKNILIATDGSDLAGKAVAQGLALAKQLNAKVTAIIVTEPWNAMAMAALAERSVRNPVADYDDRAAAVARDVLGLVSEAAKSQQVACTTLHVKDRYPAEGIVETAKEKGCDLIVMASHGHRGLSKLLLGSQAHKVVTLSTLPVLVCR